MEKKLILKNLNQRTIEQIRKNETLLNRVFISFDIVNDSDSAFTNVLVSINYKIASNFENLTNVINYVEPNCLKHCGYELYLSKEIIDLDGLIGGDETQEKDKGKDFSIFKYKDFKEGVCFKVQNLTNKDLNYARMYLTFYKEDEVLTTTSYIIANVHANDDRVMQFNLPNDFKYDNISAYIDYSTLPLMRVYEYGKKFVELLKKKTFFKENPSSLTGADISAKIDRNNKSIQYYENYQPQDDSIAKKKQWAGLFTPIKSMFFLFDKHSLILKIINVQLVIFIIGIILALILKVGLYAALFFLAFYTIFAIKGVKKKYKDNLPVNLTPEETKKNIDNLKAENIALENRKNTSKDDEEKVIRAFLDLTIDYPQYTIPKYELNELYISSLNDAIEKTDISWDEVTNIALNNYYQRYQEQLRKEEEENKEYKERMREIDRESRRQVEENEFRQQLLAQRELSNMRIESELKKQTKALNKANEIAWDHMDQSYGFMASAQRDRYYK